MKHNIIIFVLFVISIILSFKTGKIESQIMVLEERKKNAKIMQMMLENNRSFKCGEGFGVYQICVSLAKNKETKQRCRQLYNEFNLVFQCFEMEEEKEPQQETIYL